MDNLEIPDHVDPLFRFMMTQHSGMMTHLVFDGCVEKGFFIPGC
jgi:hypothetical protein